MLPAPNQPFGPYRVDHPIAQGGMGAVYRAQDTRLGRTVALKVMLPDEAAGPDAAARFLREARVAAQLDHPGIVRIYEVGEVQGTPYIAMEWIEGKPLRRAKIDRPAELLLAIAETLAHAHEQGVIHRDLKPGNVMIDVHGRAKIVDFGIAKRVDRASTFATRDGVVLGTPSYMAPEQEMTSAVDARADQYAWGVIAYELLTGDRPTRPALAHAALDEKHAAVILRALSLDPSQRFPSMRDLVIALRGERAPAVAPAVAPAIVSAIAKPTTHASHARLFVIAMVIAASFGGIGLIIGMRVRPTPVASPPIPSSDPSAAASPPPTESAVPTEAPAAPASIEPAPSVKPAARPSARLYTGIAHLYTEGSAYVDSGAASIQLAIVRPALTRCVTSMPVNPGFTKIEARMKFLADGSAPEVVFREGSYAAVGPAVTRATGAFWPPDAQRPCIVAALQKMKITATTEGEEAVAWVNIVLTQ